jgi:hypothetical protein
MRRGVIDGDHQVHSRDLRREKIHVRKLINSSIDENRGVYHFYLALEQVMIPILQAATDRST